MKAQSAITNDEQICGITVKAIQLYYPQMKKISLYLAGFLLLATLFLTSCDSVYRTDVQKLISPSALPYLKKSKMIQVSSSDTSGGNVDKITIEAGKKVSIIDVEGPGVIVRMWFSVKSPDPFYLRRIIIRMYWDNEKNPSVEVPFGDFFGCGFRYSKYMSQYLGMTGDGFICYFPMPFERQARIEIINETRQDIEDFYYQVNYQKFEGALETDVAYFHAFWNRSVRTDYDSNYVLFKTEGKGHIVGVNMNIQSYDGALNYVEGDEMVYVDGEKKPSIKGTGTDDFFSSGGNFQSGEFFGPFNGLIYKNDTLGQIAAYRLFVSDQISFRKNIKFTVEHGHANKKTADYSSTVYYYQLSRGTALPSLEKAGQRIPLRIVKPEKMIEAEKVQLKLGGLRSKIVDLSDEGADWSGNRHLEIESRDGSDFDMILPGLEDKPYKAVLYYTVGPTFGNADISVNGISEGSLRGYSPYILPSGKITLHGIPDPSGTMTLRFRITGKDEASGGYYIGLDGIYLIPSDETVSHANGSKP